MESIYKNNENAKLLGLAAETKWPNWSGEEAQVLLSKATLVKVENIS